MTGTTSSSCIIIQGNFLVYPAKEAHGGEAPTYDCTPVLISDVPLSFWGGIDPKTGVIIDAVHPLVGQSIKDTILCLPSGRGSSTASQVLLELIQNGIAPKSIVLRDLDGMACVGAIVAQEVLDYYNTNSTGSSNNKLSGNSNTSDNHMASPSWDQQVQSYNRMKMNILHVGEDGFNQLLLLQQQLLHQSLAHGGSPTTSKKIYGVVMSNGQLLLGKTEQSVLESVQSRTTTSTTAITTNQTKHSRVHTTNSSFSEIENQMLNHASTLAMKMSLRVIFRYAHLINSSSSTSSSSNHSSRKYIPITKAHIDGCTYIGPGGLQFVRHLVNAGGQVAVPTTLNAMSTDRRRWSLLGVPNEYANNAIALGDSYVQLGCQPSFTCAPYLLDDHNTKPPLPGEQLVWGESNAVVYANSVLGARTEKYADYMDICCAIAGIVPAAGVHLDENRRPSIILDASNAVKDVDPTESDFDALFPILGHVCGTLSDGKLPLVRGLEKWKHIVTLDHLKAFCAAFGTTGSTPLIHIAGITPEAIHPETVHQFVEGCKDSFKEVTKVDMLTTYNCLDDAKQSDIELVALGNPHLSVTECETISAWIKANTSGTSHKHPNIRVVACISRALYEQAHQTGSITSMETFGIEFVNDTCWCMLLDPPLIPVNPNATILTNSAKYAHYGPGLTQRKFRFGGLTDCLQTAVAGTYPKREVASWISGKSRSFSAFSKDNVRHYFPLAWKHLFAFASRRAR